MFSILQNSSADGLSCKFIVKLPLNIASHLRYVDSLPCEILISCSVKQMLLLMIYYKAPSESGDTFEVWWVI